MRRGGYRGGKACVRYIHNSFGVFLGWGVSWSGSQFRLRVFSRIKKSLRSRWGLAPCNQSIASGFGAVFDGFRSPTTPFRGFGAPGGCARPAQHPLGFARRFGSVRAVQTINSSLWRVPSWRSKRRSGPMPISKNRSARPLTIKVIGLSRCIGLSSIRPGVVSYLVGSVHALLRRGSAGARPVARVMLPSHSRSVGS
jgi:hypothetical protein